MITVIGIKKATYTHVLFLTGSPALLLKYNLYKAYNYNILKFKSSILQGGPRA